MNPYLAERLARDRIEGIRNEAVEVASPRRFVATVREVVARVGRSAMPAATLEDMIRGVGR